MLHRNQVVAGGDTGAALVYHMGRVLFAQQRCKLAPQLIDRLEAPIGIKVVLEEAIQRAGDMPSLWVLWLDLAAKAFGRTGVDQANPAQRRSQA